MGHIDLAKLREMLAARGVTSYTVKRDKIIGQATWRKLQQGHGEIDTHTIAALCELLQCQPGDIMRYVSDADEAAERGDDDGDTQGTQYTP